MCSENTIVKGTPCVQWNGADSLFRRRMPPCRSLKLNSGPTRRWRRTHTHARRATMHFVCSLVYWMTQLHCVYTFVILVNVPILFFLSTFAPPPSLSLTLALIFSTVIHIVGPFYSFSSLRVPRSTEKVFRGSSHAITFHLYNFWRAPNLWFDIYFSCVNGSPAVAVWPYACMCVWVWAWFLQAFIAHTHTCTLDDEEKWNSFDIVGDDEDGAEADNAKWLNDMNDAGMRLWSESKLQL